MTDLISPPQTCPTPDNLDLEGEERLTLDQTEAAVQCAQLCAACVELAQSLLTIVTSSQEEPDNKHRRDVVIFFLLSILAPLSTLSQHCETNQSEEEINPVTRQIAEKIMENISAVTTNNWIDILDFPRAETRNTFPDTGDLDPLSVPTYVYLLVGERLSQDRMPSVYTNIYLLRSSSVHILTLIKQTNQIRIHKGLLLLQNLLNNFKQHSLSGNEAEDPSLLSLLSPLVSVIIHQEVEELRKLGFSCYAHFVKMFSARARFSLYKYLLKTINHSGLLGWTVTSLKDVIAASLVSDQYIDLYSGSSLSELVTPLIKLKHGAETDLLEISDELLATLNFLQFLLVRDRDNKTGISDWKEDIITWTDQITEGLDMSIAHYQQKLKVPQEDGMPGLGVMVGGRELPPMDQKQMKEVLYSALNTFSIIQFNLGRLKDLLNRENK